MTREENIHKDIIFIELVTFFSSVFYYHQLPTVQEQLGYKQMLKQEF